MRAILHRPLYRGTLIWNKTKAVIRNGTSTTIRRPESEWEVIDAPDLRIVPPDLWAQVDKKLTVTRTQYVRTAKGTLLSRPSGADLRSQYLLSGVAQCAICGGSLICQLRRRDRREERLHLRIFPREGAGHLYKLSADQSGPPG